ncbi:hypothetical protein BVRB_8g194600 [Beta vulgaris subsp. vulgaris]|nr:hypothetical protein BVRB_8g194600 [Beta vulgaris subsp. vulgaris]
MIQYQEKIEDYKSRGVTKDPDEVYLEVVDGLEKDKVYGLGSASSLFYKAPTSSQTIVSPHTPLISQLNSQVEECNNVWLRTCPSQII